MLRLRVSVAFLLGGTLLAAAADRSLAQARDGSPPTDRAEPQFENSIGMTLVRIPAGRFTMGSPPTEKGRDDDELQHEITITRPYCLGKHEVTVGQFRLFVEDAGYKTEPERDGEGGWGYNAETEQSEGRKPQYIWSHSGFPRTDEHPVANVTWNDAVAFCEWLSTKERRTYRLPTEAEWEYACRAGTTTRYSTGEDDESVLSAANLADASTRRKVPRWTHTIAHDDGYPFTAPVGKLKPNARGLCDMHGNLWEWCSDWYAAGYYSESPASDPTGPAEGTLRSARGGCWNEALKTCRSADRSMAAVSYRSSGVGFRVALEGAGETNDE